MTAGTGFDAYGATANGYATDDSYFGAFGGPIAPSTLYLRTIAGCYSDSTGESIFTLGGFSSDPGVHFFSTISANGHTFRAGDSSLGSGGWQYNGAGEFTWLWPSSSFGFVSGNTYTVTLLK